MRGALASLLLTVLLLVAEVFVSPVVSSSVNETEREEFFEDALDKWLGNFGFYTFFRENENSEDDRGTTTEGDTVVGGGAGGGGAEDYPGLKEEGQEDDYDQENLAPITLSVSNDGGLLNPERDYIVEVESLVAEGGSVLVTLGHFANKTSCGVGGFSLPPDTEDRETPEGRLDITHEQDGNTSTTIVAFAVGSDDRQANTTMGDGATEWEDHSQDLWWAMGRLAGGGLLRLIFTPPECGCLTVKAHYALPLKENLTLIVGPEAYPTDLERLLCVDPSSQSIQDTLIEEETDDEGTEISPVGEIDPSQVGDIASGVSEASRQTDRGHRRLKAKRRKVAKLQRKKIRQAIRQAGRRVTRHKVRKQMREQRRLSESKAANEGQREGEEEEEEEEEEGEETRGVGTRQRGQGGKWARKQARKASRMQKRRGKKQWKGKKPWRKHKKHARKNSHRNKHNRRNKNAKHHNATGEKEDIEENDDNLNNTATPQSDEDVLLDILLGDETEEESDADPDDVLSQDMDDKGDHDAAVRGRGGRGRGRGGGGGDLKARKVRRQQERSKKWKNNKEKRKGPRFCCKQGIKYKKSKLSLNDTVEEEEGEMITCNHTNDVITTFASHQFGMDEAQCQTRFETCCSKFNIRLWESVKARKASRKANRKQNKRLTKKQQRKTERKQRRRQDRKHKFRSTTSEPSS